MRKLLKAGAILLLSIFAGTLWMTGLYALPTGRIREHIKNSSQVVTRTDNWATLEVYTKLDNHTESIMLNTAMFRPEGSALRNAMLNPHAEYPGEIQANNFARLAEGEEGSLRVDYSRYWHGYLAYLIPGLLLMDIGQVKIVLLFFEFLLTAVFLYELGKRGSLLLFLTVPVLLFLNPVTTVLSFQNADIYCISLMASIFVLRRGKSLLEKDGYIFLFLLTGIAAAFFDFLTWPLVSLCMPLLLLLREGITDPCRPEGSGPFSPWKTVVLCTLSWGAGYAGMWAGKWVAASLLTGTDQIREALSQAEYRTGASYLDMEATFPNVIRRVAGPLKNLPMLFLLLLIAGIVLYFVLQKKYRPAVCRTAVLEVLPLLVVGLFPFAWFLVLANHSLVHPWISYRELAIPLQAVLTALAVLLKPAGKTAGMPGAKSGHLPV